MNTPSKIDDFTTPRGLRKALLRRHYALKSERSSWDTHWSEISRVLLPRNYRTLSTDRNRTGRSYYNRIYDNTGTKALRVMAAGMMAGASSPGRPWFKLTTLDPELRKFKPIRDWLNQIEDQMQMVMARSNLYRTMHQTYEDMGAFGTGAFQLRADDRNLIHAYPAVVGSYSLASNWKGEVVSFYREFERTVGEVVREFGLDACSDSTRQAYKNHDLENEVKILHVIEPRATQKGDPSKPLLAREMPYRSTYVELNAEDDRVLRDSGFMTFPVVSPRWAVTPDNVYGHSPGMEALGDMRQLQQEQLRKGQAIDYAVHPPLQVPTALKDRESEMFPGGVTYYEPGTMIPFDQATPAGGIRTAYEVSLDMRPLLEDIQDVRERIRSSFFADLFLMLSMAGTNTRMTATEVAERHEEKLLMLGPTLERVHTEMLKPVIDLTFDYMLQAGMVEPPPPELQGTELDVEFVSILAQAQKAIGITAVDRFVGNALGIAQSVPEVLDNINFDEWANVYAQKLGVDSSLLVDPRMRDRMRQARAQAESAQAQVQMQREQAAAVKDMANAPTSGANALSDVMRTLTEPPA